MHSRGILYRYHFGNGRKVFVPLLTDAPRLSLGEGNTPLIPIPRIAESLARGLKLYVKYEGLNPTGSFKDRGMVVAVSTALGRGVKTVICASTGNTAASAAAYAARAGIKSIVLIPEGKVARGKLAAAAIYGARIIQIRGSFDDALKLVCKVTEKNPSALVNSLNQSRIDGQKTAAFEICEELRKAPDWLCLPVGNAGNITSYYLGFEEYEAGIPQILGVQAMGAAPIVIGKIIEKPETIATAIRIGNPARKEEALLAITKSNGIIMAVTDEEILEAQKMLASLEGIWVEPASAAGLAGLINQAKHLELENKKVVIVCTGHGLKDPDIVDLPEPQKIPPDLDAIRQLIEE